MTNRVNKTQPTEINVADFLGTVSDERRRESETLIALMADISGKKPTMWGPSIIGFGSYHYTYESGREGDMPMLGFSPRKKAITIYIYEGFHEYGELLDALGAHSISSSCLYIPKLGGIDLQVLEKILRKSYQTLSSGSDTKTAGWSSVDQYISSLRGEQKKRIELIRSIAKKEIRGGEEAISYQLPTMRFEGKNIVHYAAYRDHIALYPVPKNMLDELRPYIRGKGTLWFDIENSLPEEVIRKVIQQLLAQRMK